MADLRSGDAAKGFIGFGSCIGPVYGRFFGVVNSLGAGEVGWEPPYKAAFDAVRFNDFPTDVAPKEVEGPGCNPPWSSCSSTSVCGIRPLERRVGGVGVVGYSEVANVLGVTRLDCDREVEVEEDAL